MITSVDTWPVTKYSSKIVLSPNRVIGGTVFYFCPSVFLSVCLFVRTSMRKLSTLPVTFNQYKGTAFMFGMHIPWWRPCRLPCDLTLWSQMTPTGRGGVWGHGVSQTGLVLILVMLSQLLEVIKKNSVYNCVLLLHQALSLGFIRHIISLTLFLLVSVFCTLLW